MLVRPHASSHANSALICPRFSGSGKRGRIVIEDAAQAFVKWRTLTSAGCQAARLVAAVFRRFRRSISPSFGEIESKPLSRIRKLSAAHLHRSWVNIPHVTQTDEADITEVEAFRKSRIG